MYITQGLHRSLLETPDRIATICGDRQHTFAEFGDRIARLADALHTLGVASGDRVAILSLNSDRYLEYRLFLQPDFEKLPYEAVAIAVPTTDEYEAGDTDALCVIRKESGEPLTGDLYRAMP